MKGHSLAWADPNSTSGYDSQRHVEVEGHQAR